MRFLFTLIMALLFSILINRLSLMEITGVLLIGLLIVRIDDRKRLERNLESGQPKIPRGIPR